MPASRRTASAVNDWLAGNLCRCTGYRPIADAALDASTARRATRFRPGSPTLRGCIAQMQDGEDLFVGTAERFFAAPASIEALAAIMRQASRTRPSLSGGTDVGLWITKQLRDLPKIIHTGRAAGLRIGERGWRRRSASARARPMPTRSRRCRASIRMCAKCCAGSARSRCAPRARSAATSPTARPSATARRC